MTGDASVLDEQRYVVAPANLSDIDDVLTCVRNLLIELTGNNNKVLSASAAEVFREQLSCGDGIFVVARDQQTGRCVGVITASFSSAIRVGGRYALIQEFFLASALRRSHLGRRMLTTLVEILKKRDVCQIEVGLPRDEYVSVTGLKRVYERAGFTTIGPRMRLFLGEC